MADNDDWYYTSDAAQQHGPVKLAALRKLIGSGQVRPNNLVWTIGMAQWAPASSVEALRPPGGVGAMPPPLPPQPAHPYPIPPPVEDIGQNAGIRMLIPVGRSGWAIAAGYLGLFSFIVFPAPIALIVSIIAIGDIKRHPERHGMGRAIFGLIMGVLGTALLAFALVGISMSRP